MEQFNGKVFRADAYLPADYSDENQATDYKPIEPGTYHAAVADAEYRNTKAGNGELILIRYEIKSEPATGRTIFHNFNMSNPNETAQKIGRETFAKFLWALGHTECNDVGNLIGLECKIVVVQDKRNPDERRIVAWSRVDGRAEAIAEVPF